MRSNGVGINEIEHDPNSEEEMDRNDDNNRIGVDDYNSVDKNNVGDTAVGEVDGENCIVEQSSIGINDIDENDLEEMGAERSDFVEKRNVKGRMEWSAIDGGHVIESNANIRVEGSDREENSVEDSDVEKNSVEDSDVEENSVEDSDVEEDSDEEKLSF